jgi:U3 small nucleolar ribonucleoprotein protein LCP5
MVDYMTNLTYLMLRKSFGKSIADDPSVERLVENRTVLEKMRPIEKKLKYQVRVARWFT